MVCVFMIVGISVVVLSLLCAIINCHQKYQCPNINYIIPLKSYLWNKMGKWRKICVLLFFKEALLLKVKQHLRATLSMCNQSDGTSCTIQSNCSEFAVSQLPAVKDEWTASFQTWVWRRITWFWIWWKCLQVAISQYERLRYWNEMKAKLKLLSSSKTVYISMAVFRLLPVTKMHR